MPLAKVPQFFYPPDDLFHRTKRSLPVPTKPFSLSVKALVRGQDGQYLLILRSSDSRTSPGLWDLPGGKVEPGEHFATALIREAYEETGLYISLDKLLGSSEFEMDEFRVINLVMHARLSVESGDDLHLSEEHSEYRWVPRAQLSDFDLCPATRSIVDDFASAKA